MHKPRIDHLYLFYFSLLLIFFYINAGGGIYRPVHLHVLEPVHVVQDGLYVVAESDGSSVNCSLEVENMNDAATQVTATFQLLDANGTVVATATTDSTAVKSGATAILAHTLSSKTALARWTLQAPVTYTAVASVQVAGESTILDNVTSLVGFRTTHWDSNKGFSLNDQGFKLRGFSHHNSMAGVGVVLAPRLHLFRVQASKALGANIWRMRCVARQRSEKAGRARD